jgi:hypothetical protein
MAPTLSRSRSAFSANALLPSGMWASIEVGVWCAQRRGVVVYCGA